MRVVAVVAARAGSKRFPGKNTAELLGKPLVSWTIEAARAARRLDRILVSTDDPRVARIAREGGAEVPFTRPAELSSDASTQESVLAHAADWMRSEGAPAPTHLLLLQATSPLRTAEDIDGAIRLAEEKDADSVIGVSELQAHPFRLKRLEPDGRLEPAGPAVPPDVPDHAAPRLYAPTGSIYLVKTAVLVERGTLYTDRTYGYLIPRERSVDVDLPWDLRMAEAALRGETRRRRG